MFRNYMSVALRSLFRYIGYSVINIAGLAIALTAVILILVYIQFEMSFDKYHEKADRIYRIFQVGSLKKIRYENTSIET